MFDHMDRWIELKRISILCIIICLTTHVGEKKSFALESSSSGDTKEALEEVVLLTRKVFHSGKKSEMMIAPHL